MTLIDSETSVALAPFRLTREEAIAIRRDFGSPCFVYSETALKQRAAALQTFPAPFGLKVRFAMKACPTGAILEVLRRAGLGIDASSGWEVRRALRAGFMGWDIGLSSQELPTDISELAATGIDFNACSLYQLDKYGRQCPGTEVGLRVNPGKGSGSTKKTNTGGPSSSFGIWHDYLAEARSIAERHQLKIVRLHSHIGSGTDPIVWREVAAMTINHIRDFPEVTTVNLGGGFKVARMPGEVDTRLDDVGEAVADVLRQVQSETARALKLEIEPGTFPLANSGVLLATIQDRVDTGSEGFQFLKLNAGMTEILRPSLYASQHPMVVHPQGDNDSGESESVVVVGHCCESGDLLTPSPEDSGALAPRLLGQAEIGDLLEVGGAGAYCSAMSAQNYNSFPAVAEVLIREDGEHRLIRQRQSLDQILQNELPLPPLT